MASINPSIQLAKCESKAEEQQAEMDTAEGLMQVLTGMDKKDHPDKDKLIAEVRQEITIIRTLLGFWRGESSFWKQELQENKAALKESNALAKA